MAQLVPGDEPVLGVIPDQHHERRFHPQRRLDLLRVHHEARVAGDRDHFALGVRELGGDRARHRDSHRGKAVGDDAGVRPLGAIHARHPHLVRADVGDGDILRRQHFAQIPYDFLRLDREAVVGGVARAVVEDRLAQCLERRALLRFRLQRNPAQARGDVAQGAHRDDVMRVDLGRQRVDVDDGLVSVRIPHVRVILDHVVAHADHDVGLVERKPRQVARLEADRAQRQLVRERDDALGHERVRDRDPQDLGEGYERIGRALANDAIARKDHRILRRGDDLRGLLDLGVGCVRGISRLHLDRFAGEFQFGDVLGEIDEGAARLFRLGDLERLAHDFRHDLGFANLRAVLGNRRKEINQIEYLVAFLVQTCRRALARNGDDRSAVHVGVGDPRDQVGRTGTQRRHAHARAAGEAPVDVGHERRALLVMRGDEPDAAVEKRIHDVDVLLARNTEDVLDPFVLKAFNEQLGGGRHRTPKDCLFPGVVAIGDAVDLQRRTLRYTPRQRLRKLPCRRFPAQVAGANLVDVQRFVDALAHALREVTAADMVEHHRRG